MVDAKGGRPVKLFCCYDAQDNGHYEKLRTHLHPLIQAGKLPSGGVRGVADVPLGEDKRKSLLREVQCADIVVFLTSAELLRDHDELIRAAVARAEANTEAKECVVIPIQVRAAKLWGSSLANLMFLPKEGKPSFGSVDDDSVWVSIVEEIECLVESLPRRGSAPLHPIPDTATPPSPPIKPSPFAAPRLRQRKMQDRVSELLHATPAVHRELVTWLLTNKNDDDAPDAPEPDVDQIVASLFEEGWSAEDLVNSLRSCIEERSLTDADRVVVQEIARLVLPQSKEVREKLGEWRKQLDGKVLVLPYATHGKAEMALSRLKDRPFRAQVRESRLTSEVMFPASQIVSGSMLTLQPHHLIQEIAAYFANTVRLGPRRREEGKLISEVVAEELNVPLPLDFTNKGVFDLVLAVLEEKLKYHATAKDDDLFPVHVELDSDDLAARLEDASDELWNALRKAFPMLSFVQLNKKAPREGYFIDRLLKIFLPIRKTPA